MEIILERFDMARTCKELRKREWQLTSVRGKGIIVHLKFCKIEKRPFSSGIADVLRFLE